MLAIFLKRILLAKLNRRDGSEEKITEEKHNVLLSTKKLFSTFSHSYTQCSRLLYASREHVNALICIFFTAACVQCECVCVCGKLDERFRFSSFYCSHGGSCCRYSSTCTHIFTVYEPFLSHSLSFHLYTYTAHLHTFSLISYFSFGARVSSKLASRNVMPFSSFLLRLCVYVFA